MQAMKKYPGNTTIQTLGLKSVLSFSKHPECADILWCGVDQLIQSQNADDHHTIIKILYAMTEDKRRVKLASKVDWPIIIAKVVSIIENIVGDIGVKANGLAVLTRIVQVFPGYVGTLLSQRNKGMQLVLDLTTELTENPEYFGVYTEALDALIINQEACKLFYSLGGFDHVFSVVASGRACDPMVSGLIDVLLKMFTFGFNSEFVFTFSKYAIGIASDTENKSVDLISKAIKYLFYTTLCTTFKETEDLSLHGVETIINAMKTHPSSCDILLYGALSLSNIALREPSRVKEIMDKKGDEALLFGMKVHVKNSTIQKVCSMVLATFVSDPCTNLVAADLVEAVVSALHNNTQDVDVQVAGLGLLGRVAGCWDDEAKMVVALKANCLSTVSNIINNSRGNIKVIQSGLMLVKRTFSSAKVAAEGIREKDKGPIISLCGVIRENFNFKEIVPYLCTALAALAQSAIGCESIHSSGVVQDIENVLWKNGIDPVIICSCCDLFKVLYANSNETNFNAKAQEIVFYALRAMGPHSEDKGVTTSCFGLLAVLLTRGKQNVSSKFIGYYGLPALLESMKRFPTDKEIQYSCCMILLQALRNGVVQQKSLSSVRNAVISALKQNVNDADVQTLGLNALLLIVPSENIDAYVECTVAAMAKHRKNPYVQQIGCDLLERLGVFDTQIVASVLSALSAYIANKEVQKHGLFALCAAAKSGVSLGSECIGTIVCGMKNCLSCYCVQLQGLYVLHRLVSAYPKIMGQDGVVDATLNAMTKHNGGMSVLCFGLYVLENLAYRDSGSMRLIEKKDGVSVVVNIMSIHRHVQRILVLGFYALSSFICTTKVCDDLLRERDFVELIDFLRKGDCPVCPELFVWAFVVMGKAAYYSETYRLLFAEKRIPLFVVRTMTMYTGNSYVLRAGCFVLANIMYKQPEVRSKAALVDTIVSAMRADSSLTVRMCGCSALCNIFEDVHSHGIASKSLQCLSTIFDCVNNVQTPEVQLFGVKALGLISTTARMRKLVVLHGGINAVLSAAKMNVSNTFVTKESIAALTIMTYSFGSFASKREQTNRLRLVQGFVEKHFQGSSEREIPCSKTFSTDLASAASFIVETLCAGTRNDGSLIEHSLSFLHNLALISEPSDVLCKNELAAITNVILRKDSSMRSAFFTLLSLLRTNDTITLPLNVSVETALQSSIECRVYALKVLESVKHTSMPKDDMAHCIQQLTETLKTNPVLRLPVMSALENIVFSFSSNACEPAAGELVKVLGDIERCEAPRAFLECYFRTLMWALSEDNVLDKNLTADSKVILSKIHARYASMSVTVDKCFNAIMRVESPEVEASCKNEICTCNTVKMCKCCPAKTSGRFCPLCCCQQLVYVCDTCECVNGAKKKFCSSCWKNTHNIGSGKEDHKVTKRFASTICNNMKLLIKDF